MTKPGFEGEVGRRRGAGAANGGGVAHVVRRLVPWLIGVGVVARAISLLGNRSLWLDESMIALNIQRRSFLELVGTLDFNQVAPLGFLWLEKLAVLALGVDELALRLWPYVAGVATLFFVDTVAKRLLTAPGRLFCVGLTAVSGSLIYYASEVKQYAFDVAIAALLLMVGLAFAEPDRAGRRWLVPTIVGVVAVWFSHPVIFVLPGVLLYLRLAPGERSPRLGPLAVAALSWGASFVAAFFLTARGASQNPVMARFWSEGFMPLPTDATSLRWYVDAASGWIRNTIDFAETDSGLHGVAIGIGFALAAVGTARLVARDRRVLALVATPIACALLASALRLYPFEGRLILFLVPSTVLLMGYGLEALVGRRDRRTIAPGALGVASAAMVVFAAAWVSLAWCRAPVREELRPVLEQVSASLAPGDVVYLHSGAQHAALFYEQTCEPCRFDGAPAVRGGFPLEGEPAIRDEVARLPAASRLWTIFAHEWWGYGDIERDRLVARLTELAGPPDSVTAPGAEAYRFDFTAVETADRSLVPPAPDLVERADLALRGRLGEAAAHAEAIAYEARADGSTDAAYWFALRPAYEVLYATGDARRALARADSVLERWPFDRALGEGGLALADFYARAGQADRGRAFADAWLAARTIERPHAPLERAEALLSLAMGEPTGAIARLRVLGARGDGCDACADFDLAVAEEALGNLDAAIEAYESYLAAPSPTEPSIVSYATPYALRRLAELLERRGRRVDRATADPAVDLRRAIELYERLAELWSDPDPELRPIVTELTERASGLREEADRSDR
ncbi:MAG: glycosyltransferase family 39 protein [Gemmatimonadetes bacterium]|nr:glycosyltransferase family 39 protein [Gemmatimonadota bacterium]